MKYIIEWSGLSEETKNRIIEDLEYEKERIADELNKYLEKKRYKYLLEQVPGSEGYKALLSIVPLDYVVLSREPFKITIIVADWYFWLVRKAPLFGRIMGFFINPKKFGKKLRKRAEDYGKVVKFEEIEE